MADTKISALTAATTPLAGTEVLPIVQSGATKKVAVSDLTTGRAVSAASLALTTSPLPATSGGTGSNSAFTANGVAYASSTSALATGSGLQFNGTSLSVGQAAQTSEGGFSAFEYPFVNIAGYSTTQFYLTSNAYRSSGNWVYKTTAQVAQYFHYQGDHYFDTAPSGTAGTNATLTTALRVFNSRGVAVGGSTDPGAGNLRIDNGNLVIGTSGKGIDFSATAGTGTSELLADYEEGTWTPGYAPDTGSFTSITYNSTVGGKYVKIGTTCFITGYINTSTLNVTGASGAVLITGLPFAIAANSSGKRDNWGGGSIGYSVTFTGQRPTDLFTTGNSSNLTMTYRDSATSDSAYLDVTDLYTAGSGNEIAFSMVYKTS